METLAGNSDVDPAEAAVANDAVRRCLALLKPIYAQAILLVDVRGSSVKDSASILGISTKTLETRLRRGRNQLRDCLRKDE